MTWDELDELEKKEKRAAPREEHKLLPIDSCSQLGTNYTGRPDTDMEKVNQWMWLKSKWGRADSI